MATRIRRILGYARVSSAEQALGTSLQDQQEAIRTYARGIRVEVARMYVEAESAIHEKIERRDQMRALMAEVQTHDRVVCDKLDRWSRDPEYTYASIRKILAAGASFFAVGDNCDPSTSEGDTMLGFRVLFAREEHKRIKLRMVGTRKLLRDRGYYVEGIAPWGYVRQALKGAERNALLVDEPAAKLVRKVFRLCVEGRSLAEIVTQLGVSRDRVHGVLRNRIYLGEVTDSRGQWIPGKHAAIITPRLFVAAGEALDGRTNGSRSGSQEAETADWWLRDVAHCALCGSKMTSAYAGPKGSPERRYYFACRQRCTRRFVPVRAIETACDPLVASHLRSLRDELALPPKAPPSAPRVVDLEEQRARLQKRRERYLEAHADGHTSREELRVSMAKLDAERTKLDAVSVQVEDVSPEQRRAVLRDVRAIGLAWRKAAPDARRKIVNALANRFEMAAGQPPTAVWKTGEELARGRE